MKFELWNAEPFLRDIPKGNRAEEILKIVHKYLDYRNIEQSEGQKIVLVEFILEEIKNLPFLKSYAIRWALNQFTDSTNHNVSAAVVMAMIKKGYSHEVHKETLKKWEVEDQKNRLAPLTEAPKEELNAKARADAWAVCVDQVANSNVDFENPNWRNAAYYLAKELTYSPNGDITATFNELAIETIKKELKLVTSDISAPKDERQRATILFSDIISNNFEDKDLQSKIDSLRRKMIVRNYIETNCI